MFQLGQSEALFQREQDINFQISAWTVDRIPILMLFEVEMNRPHLAEMLFLALTASNYAANLLFPT
jgi:hypothetical protein